MKNYVEITLLPNADIALYFLWQKVYQQIHIGFASIKKEDDTIPIGVSFPGYDSEKNHLGNKLRLFAENKEKLQVLDIHKCLNRLLDYVHISSIKEVPANIESFALFKRQQVKSSITRLARRKAKRHGIDFETALASLSEFEEKQTKAPFIQMESLSTENKTISDDAADNVRHKFRLFIVKHSFDQSQQGTFNCYGLSQQATVPWF